MKLDLSGLPDQAQRSQVAEQLTKQLEAIHCKTGDNGTITLAALVEGPTQKEITYIRAGTYKFQEWNSILKFVYNGTVVWQTRSSNAPGMLMIKRGENVESTLRSLEKPNYDWFGRVKLPNIVQKPRSQPGANQLPAFGLGQSRITTNGLR